MADRLTKLKVKLLDEREPQYMIAAKCGMHPTTLSTYALGQARMSVKHMRALTKYFNCTQQDIMGWSDEA